MSHLLNSPGELGRLGEIGSGEKKRVTVVANTGCEKLNSTLVLVRQRGICRSKKFVVPWTSGGAF